MSKPIKHPPSPESIGQLCLMAFSLAVKSANELFQTGTIENRKIAKIRMNLAIGAAEELNRWLRKRNQINEE